MKRKTTLALLFLAVTLNAHGEEISALLYSFSPLAHIYLKHLGLVDKNSNGVIDKSAGEGYEEFAARYGTADTGFHANGVLYGANNGKLEEPEIINHYYLHIRFNPAFERETAAIENEVKAWIYAHNLPLVWLDDRQGTVMNAVNKVLGEGWNEQKVTEDEAVRMFNRAMQGMGITGRAGTPSQNGGYYTLPEFVTRKSGYCVEVAQLGFWFFSELKMNSICVHASLTSSLSHEVVKLKTGKMVDYLRGSSGYNVPSSNWHIINPIERLGSYYSVKGKALIDQTMLIQGVLFDKYSIGNISDLMIFFHNNSTRRYADSIIALIEYFLQNNNISTLLNAKHLESSLVKAQVRGILLMSFYCYVITDNKPGSDRIATLLQKYYPRDTTVKEYLQNYKL